MPSTSTAMTITTQRGGHDCIVKDGADLQVGDLVEFLGTTRRITHFDPYDGPLHERHGGPLPEGTRIIRSGKWGMTTYPGARVHIVDERPIPAAAQQSTSGGSHGDA